jgi:deoxyribonuclease-4
MVLNIGAHLTISKGYEKAALQAREIGANTFQFFIRNPRGAKIRDLDLEDIRKLDQFCREGQFASLVAHAPYTYNFASYKGDIWGLSKKLLSEDLERLQHINSCSYIVLHPGNHMKKGMDYGIDRIAQGLNDIMKGTENTMILLEGMSGKGTEVGSKFEELASIIDKIHFSEKIGVCLDTCHAYSAGYDIVGHLDDVLDHFDKSIGLSRLKVIHLNDSMEGYGTNKDRHATIGEGTIGLKALIRFLKHPSIQHIPIILETPNEAEGHAKEIELLKRGYEKE